MNSVRRHAHPAHPMFRLLQGVLLAGVLSASTGCALEGGENEPIDQGQQAMAKQATAPVQVAPVGGQASTVEQTVVPRGPSEKQQIIILSAPVSTNGGGVGNDEGPRPNPWTPPPEGTSEGTTTDDGKPTIGGATNSGSGATNTGAAGGDSKSTGDSKSSPTK